MATYTTKQYVEKLQKLAELDVKPFYDITQEVIARQTYRIFTKGQGSNGPLGSYSPDPIYVSNKQSSTPRRNKPVGKTGETKFKNGNPHKSTYFPGGYSEFKKAIGKGGKVNLWLFGNFLKAFMNSGGVNNIKVGNSRIKIIKSIKPGTHNPQGKLDGIFNKYPDAFKFTKGERAFVLKRFKEIFIEQLNK
jgi:hypothetical protein